MPVYNTKEEYLREAIESILNQTFTDFELLVVDDASTEDVSRVINSYSDERIHYYRLAKNEGAAGARNYALSKATGDYIALMDSDDVSYSTRFEKQIAYLEDHPEIGCLGSGADVIGDDKDKINFPCVSGHEAIEAFLIFEGCAFCQSTVMVRKSILDKYNIQYNKQEYAIAEDYALWCRLIPYTKFYNLKDPLFLYRDHAQNTSHAQQGKMRSATLAIQAIVQTQNPALYQEFLFKATHLSKFKLFNLIPFLTVKKQAQKTRVYLFGCLPLLSWKSTSKLQEK